MCDKISLTPEQPSPFKIIYLVDIMFLLIVVSFIKQRKIYWVTYSWKLEVPYQGVAEVISSEISLFDRSSYFLCPHISSSLGVSVL